MNKQKKIQDVTSNLKNKAKTAAKDTTGKALTKAKGQGEKLRLKVIGKAIMATKKQLKFLENLDRS